MRALRAMLLGLAATACSAAPSPARPAGDETQAALLRDWAVARCLTRGYGLGTPAGADAANAAAALLERGDYGMEAYEAIEPVITRTLARPASGSTGGTYTTLKCLDLARDPALRSLIAGMKPTPVAP